MNSAFTEACGHHSLGVAEDLLFWRLESVAALMLAATLLVVPAAIALTFVARSLGLRTEPPAG